MLGRPDFCGSDFRLSPEIDGGIRFLKLGCFGISAYSFDLTYLPMPQLDIPYHAILGVKDMPMRVMQLNHVDYPPFAIDSHGASGWSSGEFQLIAPVQFFVLKTMADSIYLYTKDSSDIVTGQSSKSSSRYRSRGL